MNVTTRHQYRRTPLARLEHATDRVLHATGYLALYGAAAGGVLLALSAAVGPWAQWLVDLNAGVIAVTLGAGFAYAAVIVTGLTLWLTLADAPYRPGWWP